jgi:hypothetical protein
MQTPLRKLDRCPIGTRDRIPCCRHVPNCAMFGVMATIRLLPPTLEITMMWAPRQTVEDHPRLVEATSSGRLPAAAAT